MNDFVVRKASLNDMEVLLSFEQGIISAERPYDPTIRQGAIHYYDIAELIKSKEAEVVVVEYKGRVIASGYAKIKPARHYLDHEVYGYLGFMYTHPDFRGKGVNQIIVDALRKWSEARGLKEIRLTVYDDNLAAVKAYEKVGFKKHIIEMRIENPS
ncbi:MAG: GNAT family N-acetyltransferase [Pricia sp.]|nr:GNAT family N-acetyltransferase [Pricia sp.]